MAIMTLRHYKTYYINTENTGEVAQIESSSLQYLNGSGCFGWCDPLAALSTLFTEAQLKNILTGKPTKCSLVLNDMVLDRRKPEDKNIAYDLIDFIISNFLEPTGGMILSVYLVNSSRERKYIGHMNAIGTIESNWIAWPIQTKTAWSFKRSWKRSSTEKYITYQKTEANSFQFHDLSNIRGDLFIEKCLSSGSISYKTIDYTMPPDEVFETLLHSQLHVSYVGASWWLAHYIGTPVIDHGCLSDEKGSLFGILSTPFLKNLEDGSQTWPQIIFDKNKFYEKDIRPIDTLGFIQDSDNESIRIQNKLMEHLDLSNG